MIDYQSIQVTWAYARRPERILRRCLHLLCFGRGEWIPDEETWSQQLAKRKELKERQELRRLKQKYEPWEWVPPIHFLHEE